MLRETPFTALGPAAVRARSLTKRYGSTIAVDGIDLEIAAGEFFGLLGPNGSGKTTTVHLLSTLIRPTSGSAQVAGHEVGRESIAVRRAIGVVFQEPALDRSLTVAENLRFAGLLNDLAGAEIKRASSELLELFGLSAKRHHPVAALSGGQRRALDIARGLIHQPQVLFLDEPTIGLDLPNRRAIWGYLHRLRSQRRITIFLTTHYLEEAADCDRVAFIQAGRIVASGAPAGLIESLGSHILELEGEDVEALAARLAPRLGPYLMDQGRACLRFRGEAAELAAIQAELALKAVAARVRRPNLNDVFLWVNRQGGSP